MDIDIDGIVKDAVGKAARDQLMGGDAITPRNVLSKFLGGKKSTATIAAIGGLGGLEALGKLPEKLVPWYVALVGLWMLTHCATDICYAVLAARQREAPQPKGAEGL